MIQPPMPLGGHNNSESMYPVSVQCNIFQDFYQHIVDIQATMTEPPFQVLLLTIENQCTITASPHFVPNRPRYGFNVSNFTHLRLHPAENMFKSCAKKISSGVRGNIFLANSYLFMRLFVIRGGNWIWNGIYSQPAI